MHFHTWSIRNVHILNNHKNCLSIYKKQQHKKLLVGFFTHCKNLIYPLCSVTNSNPNSKMLSSQTNLLSNFIDKQRNEWTDHFELLTMNEHDDE